MATDAYLAFKLAFPLLCLPPVGCRGVHIPLGACTVLPIERLYISRSRCLPAGKLPARTVPSGRVPVVLRTAPWIPGSLESTSRLLNRAGKNPDRSPTSKTSERRGRRVRHRKGRLSGEFRRAAVSRYCARNARPNTVGREVEAGRAESCTIKTWFTVVEATGIV
jgi:hypothetical protein